MRSLKTHFWTMSILTSLMRQVRRGARIHTFLRILLFRNQGGQALVEAPIVIVLATAMALTLLQPSLTLMVRMVVGYATGCLARAAATEQGTFQNKQDVLTTYVRHKLEVLPPGQFFFKRSSLKVELNETDSVGLLLVKVAVSQKPLPLVGGFLASSDGFIHIEEKTELYDGLAFSDRTYTEPEVVVGGR